MRKPVIAGNWKMYKMLGEAVDTALVSHYLLSTGGGATLEFLAGDELPGVVALSDK